MIISTAEKKVLAMLVSCDGPMPVDWLKSHYRTKIPRLRELGLLRKRDPEWAHLTKLGRSVASEQRGDETCK